MAIRVGVGISTTRDHVLAAREATSIALRNLNSNKIDLAILFSSIDFAHPAVLRTVAGLLGQVPIIGASSLAVISNQGIFKHGLVILLLTMPDEMYLNTASVKETKTKTAPVAGEELGEKLLYGFQNAPRSLSVIFCDGLMDDIPGFISGLQRRVGRSFPLTGGSASDNLTFENTYQYFGNEVFNNGACGMLWGGKLRFGLGIKHGWRPLGKPHLVTESQGNIVQTIDNEPAVKIYTDYLAKNITELKKDSKRISILYPIGMYVPGEDEYLLRNIFSIEDNGALIFQGDIPQDSEVRLMIGTKESCLEATAQAAEEVKKAFAGSGIDFAILLDSVSRYILLGRRSSRELETVKNSLGKDVPLIGMYTYGEQAPLSAISFLGRTYLHNQTITIIGFGG